MRLEQAFPKSDSLKLSLCIAIGLIAFPVGIGLNRIYRSSSMETVDSPKINAGPSLDLGPREVVLRQLEAIRSARENPSKISQCFDFASPLNRTAIGSPKNLLNIIRDQYAALIDCDLSQVGDPFIADDEATVVVTTVTKNETVHAFRFFLSKQTEEPYMGLWMTDAVEKLHVVSRDAALDTGSN
jgi:hypothetical protein